MVLGIGSFLSRTLSVTLFGRSVQSEIHIFVLLQNVKLFNLIFRFIIHILWLNLKEFNQKNYF